MAREDRARRRVLSGRFPGLPELSLVGYDVFTKAGALDAHRHTRAFEICLIVRGRVTWWARDRVFELSGGDVYVTWPDEPHGGLHELMHPCTIYWLHVAIPPPTSSAARTFLRLPSAEAILLCRGVHGLASRTLRGAERLEPYYKALFEHLGSPAPFALVMARAALSSMLATLAGLPAADASPKTVARGVARARELLDRGAVPWPSVGEIAKAAGMSASHLHASFAREVGMAPMAYGHRTRLARATELLSSGASVTSAAASLGYSSSQHLATCFRRYLGTTPTQAALAGHPISS
jgi:AraC family transcriptional regulator, L-rhamnose operon regulatory protein RhaS